MWFLGAGTGRFHICDKALCTVSATGYW